MNALRRGLALLLAVLIASPSPALAVSLYSGLAGQVPAPRVAAPELAPEAAAVPTALPAALPGACAPAVPAVPPALAPEAAAVPSAVPEAPAAPAAAAPSQAALAATAAAVAAAPQGQSWSALDELFIGKAKGLFYPDLLPHEDAPVAVAAPVLPEGVPSDPDLHRRMALSPLTNPEREDAVKKLFVEAGAKPEDIQIQDAGRNRHNIYVVKKGRTDRVVVVGGHHDKVSEGAGTIDNWTGATMVINLYQAMKDLDTEATFVFITFAREEEGLLGSEAYARSLTKEQLGRIDSMVNLDTLGVDGTFSWKNNSTRSLLDLIAKVAAQEKLDLKEEYLTGGDADSSTFRRLKIAAMTVFGASADVIFDIIHSARDTMAAFSLPHYRNAYMLTLALLKALDAGPVKRAGAAV